MAIFPDSVVYIHFEQMMHLKGMKDYAVIMIIDCHVEMPTNDNKTLKYNHGEKSLKAPFTIYADLECLLIKE